MSPNGIENIGPQKNLNHTRTQLTFGNILNNITEGSSKEISENITGKKRDLYLECKDNTVDFVTNIHKENIDHTKTYYRHAGTLESGEELYYQVDLGNKKRKTMGENLNDFKRAIIGKGGRSDSVKKGIIVRDGICQQVAIKHIIEPESVTEGKLSQEFLATKVSTGETLAVIKDTKRKHTNKRKRAEDTTKGVLITPLGEQSKDIQMKGFKAEDVYLFFETLKDYKNKGLIHGDLKEENTVIDKTTEKERLRFIDLETQQNIRSKLEAKVSTYYIMAPEVFKAMDPKNDMEGLNFSKVDLWAAGNVLFRFIKSKGNNTGFVPYYNQFSSSDLREIFNNSTNFVGTETEISGCVTEKKDLTMPSIEDADARLVLNLLINLLKVDPENRIDLTEIMDDNLNQLLRETSRLDAAAQTIIDHFNPPLTES